MLGIVIRMLVVVVVGAVAGLRRLADLAGASARRFPASARRCGFDEPLDISVVIDGRIADICETGFLDGTLVVPSFVPGGLQRIADSADGLRRRRGRFGALERLRRVSGIVLEIDERDVVRVAEVGGKRDEPARARGGKVIANAANLRRLGAQARWRC